ncbi:long-chain fatty acid transport protein [Luteimonas cucumeris]|uniref:Long-chain fatty acid transport protein n=1 Tax=Luteimonas cucumeris TaxID=985012 RepID=A0A562LEA2_9GAMM|nr:outer membrane protein transport protein [Luteimonas cucumeris]TWI05865.1 long-chain fatty acid transport protein [Luteimonas cucumeris]
MQNQNFARVTALALGIAGVLAFGQASASGFQIKENSNKALGRAFAGSASATGDASVVANNPAAMSTFKQSAVQADVTVIDLTADFSGGGTTAVGTPLTGNNGGDPGDATPVPSMAAIFPIGDTGMTLGAQVSAPFGLKTEYQDGWVGRYNALESDVKTIEVTLAASFNFGSEVSIGAGLIYQRAEATLSNAIDFGTALCAGSPAGPAACFNPASPFRPQMNDGSVSVTGDDTGIGWIVGMHIHPDDKLAIGFSHRSEIDQRLEGDVDFTVPSNVATVLAATAPGQFIDSKGMAPLTTPAVSTISVSYGITDTVRVMGDVSLTNWSSMRNVTIFAGPNNDVLSVEDFNWDDTVFASIGGEWDINQSFTLRAGYAQDQSPTRIETRTPRLPDADRQWGSIGLTWRSSDAFEVTAAYTRIFIDDPELSNIESSSGSTLSGTFDGHADLFGISAQYKF